jgi:hypothetical protein
MRSQVGFLPKNFSAFFAPLLDAGIVRVKRAQVVLPTDKRSKARKKGADSKTETKDHKQGALRRFVAEIVDQLRVLQLRLPTPFVSSSTRARTSISWRTSYRRGAP